MSDLTLFHPDELRALVRRFGGNIHGPNVETVVIAEEKFFAMMEKYGAECEAAGDRRHPDAILPDPANPAMVAVMATAIGDCARNKHGGTMMAWAVSPERKDCEDLVSAALWARKEM